MRDRKKTTGISDLETTSGKKSEGDLGWPRSENYKSFDDESEINKI